MKKENKKTECCTEKDCCKEIVDKKYHCSSRSHHGHGDSGVIYGLGMIGALFYFLGNATSFTMVMIGIGKAIFWPAILMFELLIYLGL
ncbi:MAG: hypothetical protein WC895_02445 [Candidatus Shapirobacteria bacterium]|jgi:hypothetical protein